MLSLVSPLFLDGPVTVGMSLDIASIDTISEINMVRNTKRPTSVFGVIKTQVKKCCTGSICLHLKCSISFKYGISLLPNNQSYLKMDKHSMWKVAANVCFEKSIYW